MYDDDDDDDDDDCYLLLSRLSAELSVEKNLTVSW